MQNINDNHANSASQTRQMIAWMREGNRITGLEALDRFGVLSFTRRICDIEKIVGYPPHRQRIQVKNRAGKKVWVKEYWL